MHLLLKFSHLLLINLDLHDEIRDLLDQLFFFIQDRLKKHAFIGGFVIFGGLCLDDGDLGVCFVDLIYDA